MMKPTSERVHTLAETQLLTEFEARRKNYQDSDAVKIARQHAIEQIKTNGLPTRRVESWHYSDLRKLLNSLPEPSTHHSAKKPLLNTSHTLLLDEGSAKTVGLEGVRVTRTSQMLKDGSCAAQLAPKGDDDFIGYLNTAFVTDGYHIDLSQDCSLETPIEILCGADKNAHMLLIVDVAKDATLVERHVDDNACSCW
jgi:Fe-S cluster assembly protein SufD